ncbi:hypothetical protein C8R46DRAFT_1030422 [Mycena filopes]|nr:hypothetical protein C8R46DRAFT_1030422 [Mycena filopes]
MTDHSNHPAPVAAGLPAAAGAGAAPIDGKSHRAALQSTLTSVLVNGALAALLSAVDALTAQANGLIGTSMTDMPTALSNLASVANAVHQASNHVSSAVANLPVAAAPGPAPPTAPSFTTAVPVSALIRHSAPWTSGFLYTVVPGAPLVPVPDNGGKWFAITRGRYIGLTQNSAVSLSSVSGVSTAMSQKFSSQSVALAHFNTALQTGALAVVG